MGRVGRALNAPLTRAAHPRPIPLSPGLDSYTSNQVMTLVKSLAVDGTTVRAVHTVCSALAAPFLPLHCLTLRPPCRQSPQVCATIHSPTAYCFSLFDSVMMLVRGQCVYFGSNGAPMTRFVHSAYPEVKAMTPGYNEAEWLVDMVTEADRQNQGPVFAEAYNASPLRLVRPIWFCANQTGSALQQPLSRFMELI